MATPQHPISGHMLGVLTDDPAATGDPIAGLSLGYLVGIATPGFSIEAEVDERRVRIVLADERQVEI